jgi:hypothetical protein
VTTPEDSFERDYVDRLLASPAAEASDAARLRALLAAAAAPSEAGPQPGETAALAAFRELVPAVPTVISLTARRRVRVLATTAVSTVVVLAGGAAAAATGSLPGPAQGVAKTVLGAVGVHVPAGKPAHPTHPAHPATPTTHPASTEAPPSFATVHPTPPAHPTHPTHRAHPNHPTHPTTTPHPSGNSSEAVHHGNPTPSSTVHPSPGHGKPGSPPVTSHRTSPHPGNAARTR